jgi:hypothetical protein
MIGISGDTDQDGNILEFVDLNLRFRKCVPIWLVKIDQQIPWHLNNFGVMVHGQ